MPISLQKGQKVSLTKNNPGLSKVVVGLGWDVNAFDTGGDFDLDAAAFLLTDTGKVSKGNYIEIMENGNSTLLETDIREAWQLYAPALALRRINSPAG